MDCQLKNRLVNKMNMYFDNLKNTKDAKVINTNLRSLRDKIKENNKTDRCLTNADVDMLCQLCKIINKDKYRSDYDYNMFYDNWFLITRIKFEDIIDTNTVDILDRSFA
jgi:hypothetical protein